jgi:6-phosphogluconolactonase
VTGALGEPVVAAEIGHPSFLALSPDKTRLFSVTDSPDLAASFGIDRKRPFELERLSPPSAGTSRAPSHVAVDHTGRTLLVSHYGDGFVASLPILPDGKPGEPRIIRHEGHGLEPIRQSSPHTHSATVTPDNRFALVCDLGTDKILHYSLNATESQLAPADPAFTATAPGAGPRHATFSPDGRHFYVINEMGGTIGAYSYAQTTGALSPLGAVSTLPSGFKGENTTAEVRVHPNGRFVYGSNRGHESIAVFARDQSSGLLSPVEIVPCGGLHPRHFALSPDGAWLVCANMNSDSLVVFRTNADTGRLTRVPGSATVSMPVCVVFYD